MNAQTRLVNLWATFSSILGQSLNKINVGFKQFLTLVFMSSHHNTFLKIANVSNPSAFVNVCLNKILNMCIKFKTIYCLKFEDK
jgi:hypothetical protein